jgi:serine/threonine-protein kinase RsbW
MSAVSEFRLRNDLSELTRLGELIHAFASTENLSPDTRRAFDLALAEWITNVISYAWTDGAAHEIELRLSVADGVARAEVSDNGRAFNPLQHPPADTAAPLEARPIGGLGIHMMRKLMDTVEYRRENGRNVVVMSRRAAGA